MGLLDRAASLLPSAIRRPLSVALGRFPAPAAAPAVRAGAPFGAQGVPGDFPPPNIPPQAWNADQPPPPPDPPRFDPGYHGHTFRAFNVVRQIGGWDIERARRAIEMHDQGIFLESYTLGMAATRAGPVHAALRQRTAPSLGVERHVLGGTRGLSRIVREEVETQLCPRDGESASVYFPPFLWGAISVDLAMYGWCILQHVYGEPDAQGIRPCFTRRWPIWATQLLMYRRTFQALTLDGPVDIIDGDGKWTIIANHDLPNLHGAVRALGMEYLRDGFTLEAQGNYVDRYSEPKPVATMPEKMAPKSKEGDAFEEAVQDAREPGGWVVLPYGASFTFAQLKGADAAAVFDSPLGNSLQRVAMILLGTDGTMASGQGTVYRPIYLNGVRLDLVRDDLRAITTAINYGRVRPYVAFNYGGDVKRIPVLSMPLPDPEKDARTKSYAERVLQLHAILEAEEKSGCERSQERVEQLAAQLDIEAPVLILNRAPRVSITDTDRAKAYRVSEIRAGDGYDPLGDERDDLTIAELDAIAKQRAAGNEEQAQAAEAQEPADGAPAKSEPKSAETAPPAPPQRPARPSPGKENATP